MTGEGWDSSGGGESRPRIAVDDQAVRLEVEEAFRAYERALVDNDVTALREAFWDSPSTVRFGIAENLHGRAAIDAWRAAAQPVPPTRTLQRTTIATFGADCACVSTEFRHPEASEIGRQSQTWVRLGEGWRIVAAHVSVLPA